MRRRHQIETFVPGPAREFHVARSARDTYRFNEAAFSVQGHVLFADVRGARDFAMRINTVRRSALHPDRAVRAGDIYAMGLIDEVFHYVITLYLEQYGRDIFAGLEKALRDALGKNGVDRLLHQFAERFPTAEVYQERQTPRESLDRTVGGVSGREIALEELIVLWTGNRNPAF